MAILLGLTACPTANAPSLSSDATLASLSLASGTTPIALSPGFASGTTSYAVTVDNSISSVTVTASAAHAGATVSGAGAVNLSVGANTILVKVTAEDAKTLATYAISVTRASSTDASLSALAVTANGHAIVLTPGFDPGVTSYAAQVGNSASSVDIAATPTNGASTVLVTGADALSVGTSDVTIRVTAQDGTHFREYSISITRAAALSSDATLATLVLTGGGGPIDLSPSFSPSSISYSAGVLNAVTSVSVSATTSSNAAAMVVTGGGSLIVGANTVSVKVTAEDGIATQTYTIVVSRQDSPISDYVGTWTYINGTGSTYTLTIGANSTFSYSYDALVFDGVITVDGSDQATLTYIESTSYSVSPDSQTLTLGSDTGAGTGLTFTRASGISGIVGEWTGGGYDVTVAEDGTFTVQLGGATVASGTWGSDSLSYIYAYTATLNGDHASLVYNANTYTKQ